MKSYPIHENKKYLDFIKDELNRAKTKVIALNFFSLNSYYRALQSNNIQLRNEAKFYIDIIKICRKKNIEIKGYGLKNKEKSKYYNRKIFKIPYFYKKELNNPQWAMKSIIPRIRIKIERRINENCEKEIGEKIKKLNKKALILIPMIFYFPKIKSKTMIEFNPA